MKLLFITQKADKSDDLLGVYHRWIEELAKRVESIVVICLYKGEVSFPANVKVVSLGKEKGSGKILRTLRFYGAILREIRNYDVVFVHMNTIYILLGGFIWKLWRKPMVLWFAHYRPNWQLQAAEQIVNVIVTSVREACAISSSKVIAIGQGIDTEQFKRKEEQRAKNSTPKLLFLGRISPVKDLDTLIEAVKILEEKKIPIKLTIVGSPTDKDAAYLEAIKAKIAAYNVGGLIEFRPRVPNGETPAIYADHDIFINLTTTGSFDKSILEAMSMELPIFVANKAYLRILPEKYRESLVFKERDAADLATKIEGFLAWKPKSRKEVGESLRDIVVKKHNIVHLAETLSRMFESLTL